MKVFKEIFNLNSSKGKMSKSQLLDFINESERLKAENIRFTYQYQQEL